MDSQAVRLVREGLRCFSSSIKFNSTDKPALIIQQAIAEDPKILYYLHSYTIYSKADNCELKPMYIHKETQRSDIHILVSQGDCEELICSYVGKYMRKLIVIAKATIDFHKALDSFKEKYSSFYPNLIKISCSKYHSNRQYSVNEYSFEYRIGRVKLAQMEMEIDAEVNRIANALFFSGASNETKIYLAHNYLATNVEYVDSDANDLERSYTQSAYGAFIKKRCVCQGYSEAFKRLMDYAGIDCYVVYGRTIGSQTLHAWNIVALGKASNYYHIDVTWDSKGNRPDYTYFCKNDDFFIGKRSWNNEYIPKCSGTYPVLAVARKNVILNKEKCIHNGIKAEVLDC